MKLGRKQESGNRKGANSKATNDKAFMFALVKAFPAEFVSCFQGPDAGQYERERSARSFVALALHNLGIDPSREVDDALIAEVREKLIALDIDYDECVETIESEEEEDEEGNT
jgi:hypothetical protein